MSTLTASPGIERLSKRNLWGYSLGGIGRDMTYQLVNTFLTMFILFAKGLEPKEYAAIGIIFIVCRIFDGCNDPFMGMLIEKTRTKIGKFKPWILAGCFSNIAIILLLFFVPLQGPDYVIFFAFGYLLWGVTYTMNDISYWGMMPSLTSHPTDRNNLSTIANVGAGLGAGIMVLFVPILTQSETGTPPFGTALLGDNTGGAFKLLAIVVCLLFAACQIMTCCVVKEKPLAATPQAATEKRGLGAMFKVLVKNDQLLVTAGSMLLYNTGSAILAALSTFWVYFRFCSFQGSLVTLFSTLTGVSMAIIVLYPFLSKKFTRKQIAKLSVTTVVVGYSLMFTLATITGLFPETRTNMVCFVFIAICGAIASFGQALYYQVLTISVSNTVEYNDLKTGSRDEGMIFAVRPFMAKMGSSFVKAVETITLTALAVIPITSAIAVYDQQKGAGDITQAEFEELVNSALNGAPDYVHFALMAVMAIVPILLVLGSFILYMKKYKIDEKEYDRICEEIRLRDQGAELSECTCDGECHCHCEDGECDGNCDCDEHCDETCECECHCHCHEEPTADEVFEEIATETEAE